MIFRLFAIFLVVGQLFGCDSCQEGGTAPLDPNPSARFGTSKSYNFFVTGEIIWFEPLQDVPRSKKITPLPSGGQKVTLSYFDQKFKPSYRASIGCNTPYDGWDIAVIYTAMRYKHNNPFFNTQLDSNGSYSVNQQGTISLNYDLNIGDLDLGRCFKVSQNLKMRPHVGVRGVWLNEKEHLYFSTLSTPKNEAYTKIKNGMGGIFAALDTYWILVDGLSIYGNGIFSAVANSQNIYQKNTIDNVSSSLRNNHNMQVVPIFDFFIGLRYDINFSDNRYHFGINVGYEQHIFLNLNSSGFSFSKTPLGFPFTSDFSLQGASIGARFDF